MTALSSTLRDSASVGCSASEAHEYLGAHFQSHDGVDSTVVLRAPIGDLAVDREVSVTLSDLPSKSGEHVMQISWQAVGGGPYPIFIGSLACLGGEAARSRIELEGTYTIPGGVAGRAFDAAVGKRIAAAAAHSLMQALVRIVEFARDGDVRFITRMAPKPYPPSYE